MNELYTGQKVFKQLVADNFQEVFSVIQTSATFHDGWKELTKFPRKGNFNPNWRDCLLYVEEVLDRELGYHPCPSLPIETRMEDRRWAYTSRDYWCLMREVCLLYRYFTKMRTKPCKRSVDYLYGIGALNPHDNDYEALRILVCNPCLDTLVARAGL
jgi:hypothetical protein